MIGPEMKLDVSHGGNRCGRSAGWRRRRRNEADSGVKLSGTFQTPQPHVPFHSPHAPTKSSNTPQGSNDTRRRA
ncbi:hypothetical protein JB92DRAFT_2873040, partial [Gautieria morchelliformis]